MQQQPFLMRCSLLDESLEVIFLSPLPLLVHELWLSRSPVPRLVFGLHQALLVGRATQSPKVLEVANLWASQHACASVFAMRIGVRLGRMTGEVEVGEPS
jgi:hypothetical protein